jgi:hypothetical protein
MTPGDVTDQPLTPGLRAPGEVRAPSPRNGHEAEAVTALEPSEPSRAARGRLRLAVAARAAIDHPNLIRAWPIGEGDGRLFVAFERCPHPSLTELLAAAPLEPTEYARILDGAAAGVDALSQRGLVGRDLTPDRVFLDPEHGGVLMDLGIPPELLRRVPLEQDPDIAFRSPEELAGKPVDLRSSVYSLGALLFTALRGLPPQAGTFDNHSPRTAEARTRPSDRRPTLSPEVEAVVARAMATDPAERFASPKALARATAAAVGAELAPDILLGDLEATERTQQPLTKRPPVFPRPNGRPSWTAPATKRRAMPPHGQRHSRPAPAGRTPARPAVPRPASRPTQGVARSPAAGRRCVAMMAFLLALAGAAGRRGHARLRRFASAVGPVAGSAAGVAARAARRGTNVVRALFLRACRLALATPRRAAGLLEIGAVVAAVAGRRAHCALLRLKRSARWVARGTGGRIDRFARRAREPRTGFVGFSSAALRSSAHRRLLLLAVGAILASALAGITLGRALEPEEGPSYVTRSGLAVQLPQGWEQADFESSPPALSSAIVAVPSDEPGARFLAGELSSQAAAERMLEEVQRAPDGRTRVQLGGLDAWRYAALRPRLHLVGTGYVVPTTGGAVLVRCQASKAEARVRLAECDRVASTLVIRGERPRGLPSIGRSKERLIGVIATLRSSRSKNRQRLAAAELAPDQAQAATALQLTHQRAARSLDRIAPLENGRSLRDLSAALRATAAAYSRLAGAAAVGSRSAYREASHAVLREEDALRRELARASAA